MVADEGSRRVAKTGAFTCIDNWLASDSMASVMGKPRRVHDYAPRPHYPMFVSLGATPRAQEVVRVRGPKVLPAKPVKQP
eukprot:5219889-Pyramimonas_sp.AAC.1